jgi:hypothetical protein
MLNENELEHESSPLIDQEIFTGIQRLSPKRSFKFTAMLTTLDTLMQRHPIKNAIDFLVEVLFREARIILKPMPVNCKFEPCGARGINFCTLFIDAPAIAVDSLIAWLNRFFPSLSAKSLNALTDEEKNTDNLTVISLSNEASITLNIDALIKNIYPLLGRYLTQDPNNVLKFDCINELCKIMLMIKAESATRIGDTDCLISMIKELCAHIREHGFGNEIYELKAQLQNINNEQYNLLAGRLAANSKQGFFTSLIKSSLQKISDQLTKTLMEICKIAHIKILVNADPDPAKIFKA